MPNKQIIISFLDEIDDDFLEEVKDYVEYAILEEWNEVELKDGIFVPRYLCSWCDDDITKDQSYSQNGVCDNCYAELIEDGDI